MNLYFWLFVLYALLITPVGAHVSVRIDKGVHYRVRLQAAGLPVLRRRDQEDEKQAERIRSADVMRGMKNWDLALAAELLREGHISRALRALNWRGIEVDARISFDDAAATAMVYAALCTCLQTVSRCHPLPVRGRVTADFHGEGTKIAARCIVDARLGSLSAAAIRLWLAANSSQAKRLMTEEEKYAAASH